MFSLKNIIIVVVILGVGALVALQQMAPEGKLEEAKSALKDAVKDTVKGTVKEATKPSPASPASTSSPTVTPPSKEAPKAPPKPVNLYGAEAEALVMKQIEAYNKMNLGDLLNTYHTDVEHIQLSSEGSFQGKDVSWKVFGDLFRKNEWLKAEVVQKMVVGDVVILIEKLTSSSEKGSILAMVAYQLQDGLIRKAWYYYGLPETTTPENSGVPAANAQLVAYNNRDMESFLAPYALDVKIMSLELGEGISFVGHSEMRPRYVERFKAEGLNAQIRARVIQGPMVIDQEYVTWKAQENPLQAIAIYFVEAGLIKNVWFLSPRFK